MASEKKVFAGPRVRRLRRERGLTQARMAADLGISASYLNLIERDQRPVSVQVLLKLAEVYDVELRTRGGDNEAQALTVLREVFSDPLFRDAGLTIQDLREIASASPAAADAISNLYRAYQESVTNGSMLAERLADRDMLDGAEAPGLPLEEVRDFINSRNNHFPELDDAAERLYATAGIGWEEPSVALPPALRALRGVSPRIAPADLMPHE